MSHHHTQPEEVELVLMAMNHGMEKDAGGEQDDRGYHGIVEPGAPYEVSPSPRAQVIDQA
ncbi:MAG: hypothetical protein WC216_10000 [Gallionella sp.]